MIKKQWCSYWNCKECNQKIKCCANEEKYLKRNLKNKTLCKTCSLKKQTGINNPFYGKQHSKESILNISKSKSGVTTSDHMSKPEYREMFSKMKKELWGSGKMEDVRTKMSILMKQRIANGELKGYNRSKAEDEIITILETLNITCQPNYIIEGKIFDIYIPIYNLLIEYNGDYWHCNPKKYKSDYINKKKNKTASEIWEYDKNKIYLSKKHNYLCETIWESEYKNNPNIIKELINKYKNYDKK